MRVTKLTLDEQGRFFGGFVLFFFFLLRFFTFSAGRCVPELGPFVDDDPPAVHQEVVEVVEDGVRRHLPPEGVGLLDVLQQLLLLAAAQRRHLVALPHLNSAEFQH